MLSPSNGPSLTTPQLSLHPPPSSTTTSPPTSPSAPSRPLVGVALFLFSPSRPSKFLIGKRLGSHGAGTYALPGGHLEFGETFEECAARELEEETGLRADLESNHGRGERGIRFLTATNDVFPPSDEDAGERRQRKHYITIFMVARLSELDEREGREARVMEPEKCEGWEWVGWEEVVGTARTEWEMEGQETKGEEVRRLFLPLRNLVKQRPGIVPRYD